MKANPHQRIIDDLHIWAGYYHDRAEGGFPKASNFINERVQSSAHSTVDYHEIPEETKRLNDCINNMASMSKAIIRIHYNDRRTATLKAATLRTHFPSMSLPVYCQRLGWIHEHLNAAMWGD